MQVYTFSINIWNLVFNGPNYKSDERQVMENINIYTYVDNSCSQIYRHMENINIHTDVGNSYSQIYRWICREKITNVAKIRTIY